MNRPLLRSAALAAALFSLGAPASPALADEARTPLAAQVTLPSRQLTLKNGLTVLLSPDSTATTASLRIVVDVGAKDDPADRRGLAQMMESLLEDPSTRHIPRRQRASLLRALGIEAWDVNVDVGLDTTEISCTLPPEDVALAIWMESDRVAFLLDGVDEETLRDKRLSSKPSGRDALLSLRHGRAALYGKEHPYGGEADVARVEVRDVKAHYSKYFVPRNMVVALAGNFDPKAAEAQIAESFGSLMDAPKPAAPPAPSVTLTDERRISVSAGVAHPEIAVIWPTPGYMEADDFLLDGVGRALSARLRERLGEGSKLALVGSALQASSRLGSMFYARAVAAEGHTLDEILHIVDEELDRLRREGPTGAQTTRASRQLLTEVVGELTTPRERAHYLTRFFLLKADTAFLPRLLSAYETFAPAALKAAAEKYLPQGRRVVVTVTPTPAAPAGSVALGGDR